MKANIHYPKHYLKQPEFKPSFPNFEKLYILYNHNQCIIEDGTVLRYREQGLGEGELGCHNRRIVCRH